MKPNGVRKIWNDGGKVVNGWLAIPNSFSAEIMAHADFDSVTVDMQHGMVEFQAAVGMLQALSTTGMTPLARVSWNDPTPIMKTLDAGAYGIVCPMINSREECERFVGACRYAPAGYRSFGPARAAYSAGANYAAEANDEILTFAMIETRQAIDNLDAILSVEGLDAIYVGPNDLSISLGFPPSPDPTEPVVVDAIDTILAAALKHGKAPGIHCGSGDMASRMMAKGFSFVTIMNDVRMMAIGAAQEIAAARA